MYGIQHRRCHDVHQSLLRDDKDDHVVTVTREAGRLATDGQIRLDHLCVVMVVTGMRIKRHLKECKGSREVD